jgi:hypothetical protein
VLYARVGATAAGLVAPWTDDNTLPSAEPYD